jgi:hypothetical protein
MAHGPRLPNPDRYRLPSNINVFVDPNLGSNSNDGLAAGAGNALQTLQAVWDLAADNFDRAGTNDVLISGATAAYAAGIATDKQPVGCWGSQSVQINLNGGVITGTLSFGAASGFGGYVQVQLFNMILQSTAGNTLEPM